MECSPSLRSECMVLPYLKGLINKVKHFYIHILLLLGLFLFLIYFHVRSITSGIGALSWAKWRIFLIINRKLQIFIKLHLLIINLCMLHLFCWNLQFFFRINIDETMLENRIYRHNDLLVLNQSMNLQ